MHTSWQNLILSILAHEGIKSQAPGREDRPTVRSYLWRYRSWEVPEWLHKTGWCSCGWGRSGSQPGRKQKMTRCKRSPMCVLLHRLHTSPVCVLIHRLPILVSFTYMEKTHACSTRTWCWQDCLQKRTSKSKTSWPGLRWQQASQLLVSPRGRGGGWRGRQHIYVQ